MKRSEYKYRPSERDFIKTPGQWALHHMLNVRERQAKFASLDTEGRNNSIEVCRILLKECSWYLKLERAAFEVVAVRTSKSVAELVVRPLNEDAEKVLFECEELYIQQELTCDV